MLFSARITELERQVLELSQERDALAKTNGELKLEIDANKEKLTKLTELETSVQTLTKERDDARQELETEKTHRETKIASEVTRRFTAAGGEPIARDPAAVPAEGSPNATGGAGRTATTWGRNFSK